jgi:transcriptional regulator with XRE-family HTH domain
MNADIHKLKTIMYERKMTQLEMAKLLKINRGTLLRRLKHGGINLTLGNIYIIIGALKMTDDEIKEVFFVKQKQD